MSVRTFGRRLNTTVWNFVWWTGSGSAVGGVKCLYDPAASEGADRRAPRGRLPPAGAGSPGRCGGRRRDDPYDPQRGGRMAELPRRPAAAARGRVFPFAYPLLGGGAQGPFWYGARGRRRGGGHTAPDHRRTDFSFAFNNPYVETALQTRRVTLLAPRFRTGLTGGGLFAGTGDSPTSNWTWTRRQPGSFRRRPRMSRFTARLS